MQIHSKNWLTNHHEEYYSPDLGWEYLGSDAQYDFYINHRSEWTSIVHGPQPCQYMSMYYHEAVTGNTELTDRYPYSMLHSLVNQQHDALAYGGDA